MSVVVWDGEILAADCQATCADHGSTAHKIKQLADGTVLAWTGEHEQGLTLAQWYESGADPNKWPEFQRGEHWTRLIVARHDGIEFYEKLPVAQPFLDKYGAWGSGRDYALGALAMGANARRAVEIACEMCITCGKGVLAFCPDEIAGIADKTHGGAN